MRLTKLASQKTKKSNQLKYELQQQQNNEWSTTKCQAGGGFGKRFSGTLSILSSSNNSGSARSIVAGGNSAQRNSLGNGSCISSFASTNNTCTNKRRKSKTTKCFGSTVFRCCLPCRGGSGSAAPATSPPLTPVTPINSNSATVDFTIKRKCSGKSAIELTTDGNESLIAAVKKHSLADTIATSATTPISLKTLINDEEEEEDLQQHISAADIAAAKLASGILPRKAEPETLSDTSISPTTAVLQLAANSASASSLLSTTTSILSTTAANTQVTFVANKTTKTQISPATPPNKTNNFICKSPKGEQNSFVPTTQPPQSPLPPLTTVASPTSSSTAAIASANSTATTTTTSSTTTSSSSSRCCCPPPQTSPLPHIKEEEESEQLLQRQLSASHDDDTLTEPTSERLIAHQREHQQQKQQQQQSQLDQLSPFNANPSGSSDSCTSLSATAVTTTTTSSITGGGCTPQEFTTTSTPSPRIKHKFRKQHKSGWSRIILAPNSSIVPIGAGSCGVATSSETLASSPNNSSSAAAVGAALTSAQTRLASSSATALTTHQSSSSQLLPASKMQAEQGSIGDLQKYHSRYLKNRRHTLANVR